MYLLMLRALALVAILSAAAGLLQHRHHQHRHTSPHVGIQYDMNKHPQRLPTAAFAEPKSIRDTEHSNKFAAGRRLAAGILSFGLIVNPTKTKSAAASSSGASDGSELSSGQLMGFQTRSGLRYFDTEIGTGPSPNYGQLVSFHYIAYYRPSKEANMEIFDSTYSSAEKQPFLQKHGNGRLIRGIEEGLHTMKVGGKRRVVIPKSLSFTDFGLGPLPLKPKGRRRLGKLIDEVDAGNGEFVYDLELVFVGDDENDQGYYSDSSVPEQEFKELILRNLNLNKQPPGDVPAR
jgi:hypothetical protein